MGKTLRGPVERCIVIGLDAPIAHRVYSYAKDGKLPAIKRLIEGGVYAENCLVPFPTITPPNWTTIVTGARIGTHGIPSFNIHFSGDPLDKLYQAFDTAYCKAEYIWNTAEKVGKKSIILNYPSTWPPTIKDGWQIGGAGLNVNEWRIDVPIGKIKVSLADAQLFSTEPYPLATQIHLGEASGWRNTPEAESLLEAELPLVYRNAMFRVEDVSWSLLVIDEGEGYERIILSKKKDASEAFAELSAGEWTGNITDEFETERGPVKAVFRCKLIELSRDAERFRLFVTPICALSGWSYPESLAEEIKSKEGLPMPLSGAFAPLRLGWIDIETFKELIEFHNVWLADAAAYLLKNKDWSLFFMHNHIPDSMYHYFATWMDPATAKSREDAELWQGVELSMYQSIDRMIGRIISAADEKTMIIIVSDHGAKASTKKFSIFRILAEAGLLVFKDPDVKDISGGKMGGVPQIDWSRTKAFPCPPVCYIRVNLKGRDPHGIVEPGKEYEEVRDEIINALYDYTDPETGKKPIALALRREDARILGLYGDHVGDVIFAVRGDFMGQHGPHLPTDEWGLGSQKGLLIMKGPGIKKNHVLKRTVELMDIVPTICHLMELPIPKDAEGGILYQALEDPDAKLKELKWLRKNYELLKSVYESESHLSHTRPAY
ncbi:MAG: hypothetical protein AYL33_007170 [Candidatus Bathyarchaeota archaeon B63]|nr:MAG: hypothetical protein AYL33_007170 [Candidatus Bathyarchaeota archaeon B63]